MREKVISYRICVTPPTLESLALGRRRRAKACLQAVQDDWTQAEQRWKHTQKQKQALEDSLEELMKRVQEQKAALEQAEKEEAWLRERKVLREEQTKLLKQRLEHGWEDEE